MGPKFKVGDVIRNIQYEYKIQEIDVASMEYVYDVTALKDDGAWEKLVPIAIGARDCFESIDRQFELFKLTKVIEDMKNCTCTSRDLFNFGCRCGGV